MTTRRWIGLIALLALALGFAAESRRQSSDRPGAGYTVACKVFAARASERPPGTGGVDDSYFLLGIAAVGFLGFRLRRGSAVGARLSSLIRR
jgi:hypothetical protein